MLKGHCMALPLPEFENEEDIPERFRELYIQKDGRWVADLGIDENSLKTHEDAVKLQQAHERSKAERNAAREELDRIRKLFNGRDPEEIQKLFEERQAAEQQAEELRLRDEKKFEEAAELRWKRNVETLKHQYEQAQAAIAEKERERAELYKDYETLAIDQRLQHEALRAGADPKKLDFLVYKARPSWRLDERRQPIAIGKTPSGEEITLDLSMADQVKGFLAEDPFLALPNRGDNTVSHQRASGANGNVRIRREDLARDSVNVWTRAKEEAAKRGGVEIEVVDG